MLVPASAAPAQYSAEIHRLLGLPQTTAMGAFSSVDAQAGSFSGTGSQLGTGSGTGGAEPGQAQPAATPEPATTPQPTPTPTPHAVTPPPPRRSTRPAAPKRNGTSCVRRSRSRICTTYRKGKITKRCV
jgi:hypothetical protein